jgi:hypothetical protein
VTHIVLIVMQAASFCRISVAKEMQEFCKNKMKELGMSGIKAWLFLSPSPFLKRRKQKKN